MTVQRHSSESTGFCRFMLTCVFLVFAVPSVHAEEFQRTPAHPNFREVMRDEVLDALKELKPAPRLLLNSEAIAEVRTKLEIDPVLAGYYDALLACAEGKMKAPAVKRELEGRRLLSVSREALGRIFAWSFLYDYTGEKKYAQRVGEEMIAVADFSDWNPSHFLDVAEMTLAMAIGYDSCKETFSEETRKKLRDAIWRLGVLESLRFKNGWKRNTANWNQVCWCGTLCGALAIYDDLDAERQSLAVDAILDSVNGVTWSMSSYEPDGNYTEGPGYWAYGTSFNVVLLGVLESAFGNDFGRSDSPSFLKTINYFEHVFGASGDAFNYPDSGGGRMFEATASWFGRKLKSPGLLYNERNALEYAYLISQGKSGLVPPGVRKYPSLVSDRLAVCGLLWFDAVDPKLTSEEKAAAFPPPPTLGYVGIGNKRCCVALFRTGWTVTSGYLGIKCGVPNSPHGHIDEGGFVYDCLGVRWVVELGPENYHRIESRGMNLWNMSQNSDRWSLLRYNNYGHSIPTVNDKTPRVDGVTSFVETKIGAEGEPSYAIVDLTPVYRDEIASAERKATLLPNGDLVIEDTFEAKPDLAAKIDLRFITRANVEILEDGAKLTQQDPSDKSKTLSRRVCAKSDAKISFSVSPCETDKEYDSKNPGVFTYLESLNLAPGEKITVSTTFGADFE